MDVIERLAVEPGQFAVVDLEAAIRSDPGKISALPDGLGQEGCTRGVEWEYDRSLGAITLLVVRQSMPLQSETYR